MLRCLSLTAEKDADKIEDIRRFSDFIDAVEIRLDLCEKRSPETVASICEAASCPVILSYRRAEDTSAGMTSPGARTSEDKRLDTLYHAMVRGVSFVDIEYDARADFILRRAGELQIRVIRSVHDFNGVPDNLPDIVQAAAAAGAIPRAACFPRDSRAAVKFLRICEDLRGVKEKIMQGMGPYGFFSSVAPWLCGSMLTFLSAGDKNAAPGQINPRELEEVYGLSRHGIETRIFGIIGNPVMHTRSPQLHNRWFSEEGMNAVYIPFQVDNVKAFMELAGIIGIRGFSVTVPHKRNIIRYMDSVSEGVRRIGSCNTAARTARGWFGSNTDFEGFLEPLKERLELGKIRKALVIGAGGAARAVVYALRSHEIEVTIVNRTAEKARDLAEEMGGDWTSFDDLSPAAVFDLVAQTTSAGMAPDIDGDPLPGFQFRGSEIVYDIIYAPEKTHLLARAETAGCTIIGGSKMLRAQAELQFSQFKESCNL